MIKICEPNINMIAYLCDKQDILKWLTQGHTKGIYFCHNLKLFAVYVNVGRTCELWILYMYSVHIFVDFIRRCGQDYS